MKKRTLDIIIILFFLSLFAIPIGITYDVMTRDPHPRTLDGYWERGEVECPENMTYEECSEYQRNLRIQPVLEWQNKYYAGRMPLRLLIASIVGFCLTIGTILFVREEDITNESSTIHKSEHSGSESRDADKSSEEES